MTRDVRRAIPGLDPEPVDQAPGLGRAVAQAALGEELAADLRPEAELGRRGEDPEASTAP
jgi:hypothetical protein